MTAPITAFVNDYWFLSNFCPARVRGEDGAVYPSVEHAFQATKTADRAKREQIRAAPTAGMAKRLGRHVELRPDWEQVKFKVMGNLLDLKFAPKSWFAERLLDTGEAELVEGNHHGDTCWGRVNGVGENHLGRLLMGRRSLLRSIKLELELPWPP